MRGDLKRDLKNTVVTWWLSYLYEHEDRRHKKLKGRNRTQGAKGWTIFHSQVGSWGFFNTVKLILQIISTSEEKQWAHREKRMGFGKLMQQKHSILKLFQWKKTPSFNLKLEGTWGVADMGLLSTLVGVWVVAQTSVLALSSSFLFLPRSS